MSVWMLWVRVVERSIQAEPLIYTSVLRHDAFENYSNNKRVYSMPTRLNFFPLTQRLVYFLQTTRLHRLAYKAGWIALQVFNGCNQHVVVTKVERARR